MPFCQQTFKARLFGVQTSFNRGHVQYSDPHCTHLPTFRLALLLHFNATLKRFKLFVHHFETNLAKMFKYVGLIMMSSFGLADLMLSPIFY